MRTWPLAGVPADRLVATQKVLWFVQCRQETRCWLAVLGQSLHVPPVVRILIFETASSLKKTAGVVFLRCPDLFRLAAVLLYVTQSLFGDSGGATILPHVWDHFGPVASCNGSVRDIKFEQAAWAHLCCVLAWPWLPNNDAGTCWASPEKEKVPQPRR